MIGRQKRLHEAFEHLRKFFGIHTQTDFAEVLKYSRVYISSALNGNEKNLTDKLFTNICEAYPGVFNLNYLLTGEGDLLTLEEEVSSDEFEKKNYQPQSVDLSSAFNAAIAAHVRIIDNLEAQLDKKEMQSRLSDKDVQINELKALIKEKDAHIITLNSLVADLRRQLTNYRPLQTFPLPGMAEEIKTNI